MNLKTLEEFNKTAIETLEESFITEINIFKKSFQHVLEDYNVTYDKLCQTQLESFKIILNSEDFKMVYEDANEMNDGFVVAFEYLLENQDIESILQDFYDKMFNYAYLKAIIITEQKLVNF